MERVVYTVDTGDARRFFEYAGFRARRLREPLMRAGHDLLHHINATFATEGGWIGNPWPGLSTRYEQWKEEHYPGRPMLVLTGLLRRVAISERSIHVRGSELVWEISVPYAELMQEGGTFAVLSSGANPRMYKETHKPRPFVEVTPELTDTVENTFRVWLEELKSVNRARAGLNLVNPFD